LSGLSAERSNGQELEDEDLTLLEFDLELVPDLWCAEEVLCRQHTEITVCLCELLVVLKDLRVHGITGEVGLADLAILGLEVLASLGEVEWLHVETGSLVHLTTVTEGIRTERLREAAVWLTHQTLEEFEHRAREVKLFGLLLDALEVELILHHELCKVTDDFRCWGDLDNVTKQIIGLLVGLLRLCPLSAKTKLGGLEDEIRELSSWYLMFINILNDVLVMVRQ